MSKNLTESEYREMGKNTNAEWVAENLPKDCDTATIWKCYKNEHVYSQSYSSKKQQNQGCPYCSGNARLTKEKFMGLAERTNSKWIEEEPLPRNSDKTEWICSYGHNYLQDYSSKNKGHGCPICSSSARKTEKDYIELGKLHGEEWIGNILPKNNQEKTMWCCSYNHEYDQSYHSKRQSSGCPICAKISSKGERKILNILEDRNINVREQVCFDGLIGLGGGKLRYDFLLTDYNILIEFNGLQHYEVIEYFGGEAVFKKQIEHDRRKEIFAKENGYKLLIFNDESKNIEHILNNL